VTLRTESRNLQVCPVDKMNRRMKYGNRIFQDFESEVTLVSKKRSCCIHVSMMSDLIKMWFKCLIETACLLYRMAPLQNVSERMVLEYIIEVYGRKEEKIPDFESGHLTRELLWSLVFRSHSRFFRFLFTYSGFVSRSGTSNNSMNGIDSSQHID
jgi:hypothetical protein